ncbi:MAG: MotA/TolQ/ExbB proton channel family protein [Nitrospiria bacterium]
MKKDLGILVMILSMILGLYVIECPAAEPPASMDELFEQVRKERILKGEIPAETEARFLAEEDRRAALLKEAEARLEAEEKRNRRQKEIFERNEVRISAFETRLKKEAGALEALFAVVRQHAREAESILAASLVSAQKPGRAEVMRAIAEEKRHPSIEKMEGLWLSHLEEMTESGKVVRFTAPVVSTRGEREEKEVIRVGLFNAVSEGHYLRYVPESGKLAVFSRQPPDRFTRMARGLEKAKEGIVPMGIDPSRGAILSLLVQTPNTLEQLRQGGMIGGLILAIGGIALLVIGERFAYLSFAGRRIVLQVREEFPKTNNALGRIMRIYTDNPEQDVETLELRLDEATIKEIPRLERGLSTVAILAAIAPLLGLLGTVTGMIETFQSITLFGTGDPKLMSGGISQALVTTELGLVVAIPIVLLHSFISGKRDRLVQILDEQSAGIVARLAEKQHAHRP